MTKARHPTQTELLENAISTIERVLLPDLASAWSRSAALGLVGQLRYALGQQGGDSLARHDEELAACLVGLLAEHSELEGVLQGHADSRDDSSTLRERASALLVHAIDVDGEGAAAGAIRERLRPLLAGQVAEEIGEAAPMLQAFIAAGSVGSKA